MKENHPELLRLLDKFQRGQCSEEEEVLLVRWLMELEKTNPGLPLPEAAGREDLRRDFIARIQAKSPTQRKIGYWKYAAAAALLCLSAAIGFYFLMKSPSLPEGFQNPLASSVWDTLSTKSLEVKKIRMEDQTTIVLNANSRLRFNKGYGHTNRRIELIDGEVSFNVAKNANLPFKVAYQQSETTVLGTRFIVSSYEALAQIGIEVIEGKVALALPKASYPGLTAGEAVYIRRSDGQSMQARFDRPAFDPERRSCFLRNATFDELAFRIRNVYGYDLKANKQEVADRKYTGEFLYQEPVDVVLRKFSEIHGGSFHLQDKEVIME